MQIILNNEEIETILDALITNVVTYSKRYDENLKMGKDTRIGLEYIKRSEALYERFLPYLESKCK